MSSAAWSMHLCGGERERDRGAKMEIVVVPIFSGCGPAPDTCAPRGPSIVSSLSRSCPSISLFNVHLELYRVRPDFSILPSWTPFYFPLFVVFCLVTGMRLHDRKSASDNDFLGQYLVILLSKLNVGPSWSTLILKRTIASSLPDVPCFAYQLYSDPSFSKLGNASSVLRCVKPRSISKRF